MATIGDNKGETYSIMTASDITPPESPGAPYTVMLESVNIQQVRKLPGGGGMSLQLTYNAAQPITLQGYVSLSKPQNSRPLQGTGVSAGQRVLTGSGTLSITLGNGFWTIA